MADIIPAARPPSSGDGAEPPPSEKARADAAAPDDPYWPHDPYWYVEALFFAYRDFTGDADRILNEIGFGRAHHRVLHFVHRYPGMRVADLLEILQITKQSLARVLRELIKEGYVAQRSGQADRRERLLYVTEAGGALADRLAAPQLLKIGETLGPLGAEGRAAVARFLSGMMAGAGGLPAIRQDAAVTAGDAGKGTTGKMPVPANAGIASGLPLRSQGNRKRRA